MAGFPQKVRALIEDRAGGRCERCTRGLWDWSPKEIHHRRARAMGGSKDPRTNTTANGVLLCPECHRFIESFRTKAMDLGWLVRQGQDPSEVPVYYHGNRWVRLTTDGVIHEAGDGT